ncbi:nucleotidyltransferase family protein [Flavobacterium sp. ANB]|uniref:nucleotidyltransferase family protein n=1 Tax=unclassified Flavobacterium TaxID=196869 RepID=UPI0012B8B153|nr:MULTISPECIES: nucleotidyltransferase family protein [unclassified Flavobacterium]MBF4516768.1 nucleotidyltransferase family protein [Flavobacterium sp. ANB]MTD69336.1 NTP transferase domain-containing protein [Flavobacterium sp. LC2016-13]
MKDDILNKTGIVILAAGSSARLGQPKQLLAYKNTTLLKNTIKEASLIRNAILIVVTGSNHALIKEEIKTDEIKISYNPDWEIGMSSSIAKGLSDLLLEYPQIEKCIFAVCDQPYVSNIIFENLMDQYEKNNKGIIASAYAGTLGTPVLFDKKYFKELLALKGQEGAKKIINRFLEDTVSVPFEKGNIDIDTPEDYNNLIS